MSVPPPKATVTCTNNVAQSASANLAFTTCTFTNAETCALLNRFDVLPDATHEGYIDTAIGCLKTNNVWNDLDVLGLALNDQFNSLLNWKSPSFNASTVSSPTFVAYKGFTGDGTSSYVDVGYKPGISGASSQNSLATSLYSLTSAQQANASGFSFNGTTTIGTTLNPRTTGDLLQFRVNSSTASTVANIDGSGWVTIKRANATQQSAWRRGTQVGTTQTVASAAPSINDAGIGHAIGAMTFSTLQGFGWAAGAAYADLDEPLIYACLHTYAQNVGAE